MDPAEPQDRTLDNIDYISTRGAAPRLAFDDVLLAGLARDGGLYVPSRWPTLTSAEIADLRGLPYAELAVRIMTGFLGKTIPEDAFRQMVADAYAEFDDPDVAPVVDIGDNTWLMELFHGPTLAFKDFALQLVGRLFDHVLNAKGQQVTIIGATSGDTGSAAIAACRDRDALDIFMLHPHGRVSEVQRRQMTTVDAPNVYNVAIEGTFDDCQDVIKALFQDESLGKQRTLSAVNSINWARVLAQIVYYFNAALRVGGPGRAVAFAVPTGNFGNVYAGYGARAMGLPIEQLIVGSNRNDILTRFFDSGEMALEPVEPSLSPSMDIQISSNFERLLFDLFDRDGPALADCMVDFRKRGIMSLDKERWRRALEIFSGARFDDDETLAVIRELHETQDMLVDPHTAIGIAAGRARRRDSATPLIALATAHPAKFPDAVEKATGVRPGLPPHLSDLFDRAEHCVTLPNDLATLRGYVAQHAGRPRS